MVKLHPSDPLPAPPVETINTVNAMTDPAAIIGPDFRIVHVNPAFQSLFGYSIRDVCGLPCYEITHKRSGPCAGPDDSCPMEEAIKTGRPVFATHVHYTAEGEEVRVRVECAPLRDEEGNVTRVVEIMETLPPETS